MAFYSFAFGETTEARLYFPLAQTELLKKDGVSQNCFRHKSNNTAKIEGGTDTPETWLFLLLENGVQILAELSVSKKIQGCVARNLHYLSLDDGGAHFSALLTRPSYPRLSGAPWIAEREPQYSDVQTVVCMVWRFGWHWEERAYQAGASTQTWLEVN